MRIPYESLFTLEQKFLPLCLLAWDYDRKSFTNNFSVFCKKFDESLENFDFLLKTDLEKEILEDFVDFYNIVCFSFPFSFDEKHIGLCKNMYVGYDKENKLHLFLEELNRDFDGKEWSLALYMWEVFVEKEADEFFIRKKQLFPVISKSKKTLKEFVNFT